MRRHLGTAGLGETRREARADRLARLTREIVEQTGAHAVPLLKLIERRSANVSADDSAAFILEAWKKDGDDRERLIAHAMKDDATLSAERELSRELQRILKPFSGARFDATTAITVRRRLVQYLRGRVPISIRSHVEGAVDQAVEFTGERLEVRTDGLVRILNLRPLAS